jgi:DNA-directed RNA polymerase subunit H (RpoH/RPB5)
MIPNRRVEIDETVKRWFTAYETCLEMMADRNMQSTEERYTLESFALELYQHISSQSNIEQHFIPFRNGAGDVNLLGMFTFDLSKPMSAAVVDFVNGYAPDVMRVSAVVVALDIKTGDATRALRTVIAPSIHPRSAQQIRRPWIDFFYSTELQSNPLKHCLQPEYSFLPEAEHANLRINLTRCLQGKQKEHTLYDLLPKILQSDIVVRWFGAQVGDIFVVQRLQSTVYRIVVPPLIE